MTNDPKYDPSTIAILTIGLVTLGISLIIGWTWLGWHVIQGIVGACSAGMCH